MQKPQILSTRPQHRAAAPSGDTRALVFDACHVGVVLRAVLGVELVLAVALLLGAASSMDWLLQLALLSGAVLPMTLAWLLAACSLQHMLQRLSTPQQYAAGALLGTLAGLGASALLQLLHLSPSNPALTWLASAGAGALLALLLVAALVWRARARAPAATTARLTELQARIRPHFLFNTLNSAIALVREEPARAEALLEDLSDLFRHALLEQGESTSLEQELALAQHYLAIEQVRFGPRLQVDWSLDARANAARLPPLLLQPLVENAVKHGVEPSPEGGDITIRSQLRASRAIITISNTLPPDNSPSSAGHGIALANVRERLRLLHDVDCDFSAGVEKGMYRVRISVPNS